MKNWPPPPENSIRIMSWVFLQPNDATKTAKNASQLWKNQHIKIVECSRHPPDLSTIKTLNEELRIQILLRQLQSLRDCEWFTKYLLPHYSWIYSIKEEFFSRSSSSISFKLLIIWMNVDSFELHDLYIIYQTFQLQSKMQKLYVQNSALNFSFKHTSLFKQ